MNSSAPAKPNARTSAEPKPANPTEVERAEFMLYLDTLKPGMTVLDVGANIGELTLLFARFVGPAGRVHAFEPGETAFDRLRTMCDWSGYTHIIPNRLALAEKAGTVRLNVYDDAHLTWNTMAQRPLADHGIDVATTGTESVPAQTVDDYCTGYGIERVDLLKIDVEGAELQVLRGAGRMLQEKRVGCCVFEFGQTTLDMGNSAKQIQDYLLAVGYSVRNVIEGDPVFPTEGQPVAPCFSMHLAEPMT
ncbi:MAG: FkbM family methyltransferase [Phycisphaerae bacterium]